MIAHEKQIREEVEKRKIASQKIAMEKDAVLKEHIACLKFELEQRKEVINTLST